MNAAELLNNSLSPDQATRDSATQQLEAAEKANFHAYLHTLAAELAKEDAPLQVRSAAGLAFKNAIQARNAVNQPILTERWMALPLSATAPLKQSLLSTLGSSARRAGAVAAQCVAAIAAVDLPEDKWPELIALLLEFVGNQENVNLRVATLQAVGYICEVVQPEVLSARSNEILTAVVQGARKEETSTDVQAAAIQALYNSLDFIRDNFEREGERNYIMQVVCEATQNSSVTVQVGAFECLVRIMSTYYDKMDFYMERALFGLTIMGMRHQEEAVALQAIEFWSTVCDTEIDLAIEAQEASDSCWSGILADVRLRNMMAMSEILPVLLDLLTQQEEDADEDDWTRSMAAGACLELMARNVQDPIVQPVVPFVEAGIQRPEWQNRDAAVMAFGAILDGPDPSTLAGLVRQALPGLIDMLRSDPSVQVKDTVAWTLSKVTEIMLQVIDPVAQLQPLVTALVFGLTVSPKVANSCCSALSNLAAQLAQPSDMGDEASTSMLSPFYSGVITSLMPLSEKPTNEANSRTAAYQTIANWIAASALDTLSVVEAVVVAMLTRQEALIGMQNQLVGSDDRNNWIDMQIGISIVLQSALNRAPQLITPFADRIMTNLLQLLTSSGTHSGVLEDVFAMIGSIAGALEAGFVKYMPTVQPFIITALTSLQDYQVVQAGIYVAGDIARAMGNETRPFAEPLMVALVDILRSPTVLRSVKPSAVTAIGDVAMAIEFAFLPFLEGTLSIMAQAGSVTASPDDTELLEFVWAMRESIIDCAIGIFNGIKGMHLNTFKNHVVEMVNFSKHCYSDPTCTETFLASMLGLIGDLAKEFPEARNELREEWVQRAISQGRVRGSSKRTRANAAYAAKTIRELQK
ncbi:importin subunit beta-1 [Tremella mesenterica]|uniref:Importin-95 n=1 Tax=Tremella mesenterica TaxID=5217 RepID=A0A4V1M3P4_TREME|nr:importin subunit beta-1 [Tremella mesenterica]